VRAGSIVPMGRRWSGRPKGCGPDRAADLPGADGDFTLYEDENDSYRYEKGAHATIAMHWDDGAKTLTLGAREGGFAGMLRSGDSAVVLVGKEHGVGIGESAAAETSVFTTGRRW